MELALSSLGGRNGPRNMPTLEMNDIITETKQWYKALDLPKSFSDIYGFTKIIQKFDGLAQSVYDSICIAMPKIQYEIVDIKSPVTLLQRDGDGDTITIQIGSWLFKYGALCKWYAPFSEMNESDAVLVVIAIMNGAVVHELLHHITAVKTNMKGITEVIETAAENAPLVALSNTKLGLSKWTHFIVKVLDDFCMERTAIANFHEARWWQFMPLVNRFFFQEDASEMCATEALRENDSFQNLVHAVMYLRNFSKPSLCSFSYKTRAISTIKRLVSLGNSSEYRASTYVSLLVQYLPELFEDFPPPKEPPKLKNDTESDNTESDNTEGKNKQKESIDKFPKGAKSKHSPTHPTMPTRTRHSKAKTQGSRIQTAKVLEKIFPEKDGKPNYGGWHTGAGKPLYFDSVAEYLKAYNNSSLSLRRFKEFASLPSTIRAIDDTINKRSLRTLFMARTMDVEKSQPCRTGITLIPQRISRIVTDQKMFSPLPDEMTERPSEVLILLDYSGSMRRDVDRYFMFPRGARDTSLVGAVSGVGYSLLTGLARANVRTQLFVHSTLTRRSGKEGRESCAVVKLSDTFSHRNSFVEISCAEDIDNHNNQDHMAINECVKHFTVPEDGARTLVVLSDGRPAGAGYSGSDDALTKTKAAVNDARARGIVVYSLSLIEDVVYCNNQIYGEKWNIKLGEFPLQNILDELVKIVTKETERSATNVYTG